MAKEITVKDYLESLEEACATNDPRRIHWAIEGIVGTYSHDRRIVAPVTAALDKIADENPKEAFLAALSFRHAYTADHLIVQELEARLPALFNRAVAGDPAHIIHIATLPDATYDKLSLSNLAPDILNAVRAAEQTVSDERAHFFWFNKPRFLLQSAFRTADIARQGSAEEAAAARLYKDFALRYAKSDSEGVIKETEKVLEETKHDPQSPMRLAAQDILAALKPLSP